MNNEVNGNKMKLLRKRCAEYNRVIHTQNLYLRANGESIRLINGHVAGDSIAFESLNTGKTILVTDFENLYNGRGERVTVD